MARRGCHRRTCKLFIMFHRDGLDSRKMAIIDRVQNGKQVSRFSLDHSCARNERVIRRKKQRKEKQLKH